VRSAGGELGDAKLFEPLPAVEQHVVIAEDLDPFQHRVRPMRNDLDPAVAAGRLHLRLHEAEVPSPVVGADVERIAVMVDVVFVLVLADGDHPEGLGRSRCTQVLPLGGGVASAAHEHVLAAPGAPHERAEELVAFFVEQRIRAALEMMAVDAIRPLGGVVDGVEQRLVVRRPRQ
jgi:hypothetical protein